jgi:hypothetical protein
MRPIADPNGHNGVFLQEFGRRQQCPVIPARQRLRVHRPEEIDAHHLGYAKTPLRSVLFGWPFKNALPCLVSMRTTGNPAFATLS